MVPSPFGTAIRFLVGAGEPVLVDLAQRWIGYRVRGQGEENYLDGDGYGEAKKQNLVHNSLEWKKTAPEGG